MKNLLIAAAAAAVLAAGTVAAHATSIPAMTVTGNYSVTYTKTTGNGPSFTKRLSDPFSISLAPGSSTSNKNFFTEAPASSCGCGTSKEASGTINVSFTNMSDGNSTASDASASANYLAKYSNHTDSVTWGVSSTPFTTGSQTLAFNFGDGAVFDVTLNNAFDWDLTPKIGFSLPDGPTPDQSVPEPGSLALLGTALFGLGLVFWRRQRA